MKQNEELASLRAENAELTAAVNHAEAVLLFTQQATHRLLAQKIDTETKYQSLLKELNCIVEHQRSGQPRPDLVHVIY